MFISLTSIYSIASICLHRSLLIPLLRYPLYKIKFKLVICCPISIPGAFCLNVFSDSRVELIVKNQLFNCLTLWWKHNKLFLHSTLHAPLYFRKVSEKKIDVESEISMSFLIINQFCHIQSILPSGGNMRDQWRSLNIQRMRSETAFIIKG